MKKKTRCYIYTRVSTAIQVDGYSLDAQKDKLRKYAEFQDMEIVGEYSDEGHSGKNIKGRQGFMRMLNDIEDGKDGVEFCNSTAGRLIYAHSHYNMCAGGGYMYQISNEKFGLFVTELRKEKNLTQKDLAEKLYVSDKTVSKWERGLSMPNVVLLIPIADILDVTVTELLRGEKIDTQKNIDKKEIEELVVGSFNMAVRDSIHQHRKNWILAYLLCFFISITEIIMLVVSGSSLAEMKGDILLVTGGMLLFGAWFCFFAKDILPTYYDANKINYVSQGIFRIHLVGLSFNNGNWIYICTTLKIWTLATVVLYPLAGIIIINCFNIALWDILNKIFLIMILGGMVVSIYIIGKKYE